MPQKVYDDYWNFTLAYTDFNGSNFIGALGAIVSFIDRDRQSDSGRRGRLEHELSNILNLNDASVRKVINQFVKMGFIETGLISYHEDAKPYINARNDQQRRILLSRIVYSNASFARSATVDSNKREINFIVKTLKDNLSLDKHGLAALMRMEVTDDGAATADELAAAVTDPALKDFEARKYNQIDHLWNLLSKLDGIVVANGLLSLQQDATGIEDETPTTATASQKRDPYLQQLMKSQLKNEVVRLAGRLECMVEGMDYLPHMYIASHIKPFSKSSHSEEYDPNNCLLLGLTLDKFFDGGFISFDDDGKILVSKRLNKHSQALNQYLSGLSLDNKYLNDARKKYLAYHRQNVFN